MGEVYRFADWLCLLRKQQCFLASPEPRSRPPVQHVVCLHPGILSTLVRCTLNVVRSTLQGQFSTCLQYAAVRSVCLSALLLLLGCVPAQGLLLVGLVFVKGCCNMWHASNQDPYMPPIQASTLVSTLNRPVVLMCHLHPTAVLQIAFHLPSARPSL
mgnify:CR=1 FL=1